MENFCLVDFYYTLLLSIYSAFCCSNFDDDRYNNNTSTDAAKDTKNKS